MKRFVYQIDTDHRNSAQGFCTKAQKNYFLIIRFLVWEWRTWSEEFWRQFQKFQFFEQNATKNCARRKKNVLLWMGRGWKWKNTSSTTLPRNDFRLFLKFEFWGGRLLSFKFEFLCPPPSRTKLELRKFIGACKLVRQRTSRVEGIQDMLTWTAVCEPDSPPKSNLVNLTLLLFLGS